MKITQYSEENIDILKSDEPKLALISFDEEEAVMRLFMRQLSIMSFLKRWGETALILIRSNVLMLSIMMALR